LFAEYSNYYEISIHVTSICRVSCCQFSGDRSYNSSSKWVALTRTGWRVVCVVDYPASSIRWVAFHKVVRRHYFGEVGEFTIFWSEISSGLCTPKTIKIGSFFAGVRPCYSKYKKDGALFCIVN